MATKKHFRVYSSRMKITVDNIKERKVLVVGLGKSGIAAVEAMVNEVFPPKLSKQNDGAKHERLRNVLEISFDFFSKIQGFDLADLSRLIANLNLLMNPLSHKSTETNVYKIELKEIFFFF